MKPYVFSLLAGVLAGAVYSAISVHSPAPPVVALTGLLGMLAGEQILPVVRRSGFKLGAAWREAKCGQHMFGSLPGNHAPEVSRRNRQPS
jgi:XapX domain-containing protein